MASNFSFDTAAVDCPFEQLTDELVAKILGLACEEPWDAANSSKPYPLGLSEQTWVSSHCLSRVSTICRRFRGLLRAGHFQYVVWKCAWYDQVGCAKSEQIGARAVLQGGKHLRGLIIDHLVRPDFPRFRYLPSASIEMLTGILRRSSYLETFCLRGHESRIEAGESETLWRLIAHFPKLRSMWLLVAGMEFRAPLQGSYWCSHVVDVNLDNVTLSDSFVCSLLERLPALKTLRLSSCMGLIHPSFKSEKLQSLELEGITCSGPRMVSLSGPRSVNPSRMSIDAPNLTSLKGVPELLVLDLKTPNLKILSMGWVQELNTGGCNMSLSSLTLEGRWEWGEIQHVLYRYGASDLLDISRVGRQDKDSELTPLSFFLGIVPSTLASLVLGATVTQLYESDNCAKNLKQMRFEHLNSAHFKVSELNDLRLIDLILQSCSHLRDVVIDMVALFRPIDHLVSKVAQLQAANPRVRFIVKEPDQVISSTPSEASVQDQEGMDLL